MPVLTYRDYAALPDDGHRYELWEGDLHEVTSPGIRHQRIAFKLARVLADHVETLGLGEVFCSPLDVLLSDLTVLQPDVTFVGVNRSDTATADHGIEGAPTLVVEILSSSTAADDRGRKRELYARYGVPYYWIVDGDAETIEAYVLEGESYRLSARAAGEQTVDLPPFDRLDLVPATLFPARS